MWSEIKRKLFHMSALIYVVGIIYLPRAAYLGILAAALVVVLGVEFARLRRPALNDFFQRRFGGIIRESEREKISGITWMLAGVTVTVALVEPLPLACTALLYLILGDGIASLAGLRLGGPHWPGSKKRVAGSAACLLVCLVVGVTLLRPQYGWHGVLIGAGVATALEWGVYRVNDNFAIPVGSGLSLLACYGVAPFAGLWR